MKKIVLILLALAGLSLMIEPAQASWGMAGQGAYHSLSLGFGKDKCDDGCGNDKRWQKFWRDYYKVQSRYYHQMGKLDWVTYYKYHGYMTNPGGQVADPCNPCVTTCQPAQYAPVMVQPTIQWMVPNTSLSGPACPPQQ